MKLRYQIRFEPNKLTLNAILSVDYNISGLLTAGLEVLECLDGFEELRLNFLLNLILSGHLVFLHELHLEQRGVLIEKTQPVSG